MSKGKKDWEFELFLAKEQGSGLPLLPVTLNTKHCESTEFSNSSGSCVRETTVKKIIEGWISFLFDGEVSIYKWQRKCALMWMNSSTLTRPTCHPQKHINCTATNFTFINCVDTQSACRFQNQDYQIMPLPTQFTASGSYSHFHPLQPNVNDPFTYFRCHWLFQTEPAITISLNHQTMTFTLHLWFSLAKNSSSWLPNITIDSFNYSSSPNHSFNSLEIWGLYLIHLGYLVLRGTNTTAWHLWCIFSARSARWDMACMVWQSQAPWCLKDAWRCTCSRAIPWGTLLRQPTVITDFNKAGVAGLYRRLQSCLQSAGFVVFLEASLRIPPSPSKLIQTWFTSGP